MVSTKVKAGAGASTVIAALLVLLRIGGVEIDVDAEDVALLGAGAVIVAGAVSGLVQYFTAEQSPPPSAERALLDRGWTPPDRP